MSTAPTPHAPPADVAAARPLPMPRGWPFLALGLGLLVVGVAFWRPVPAGVWHDDGVYLVIGQSLAAGEGLAYSGVPGDLPAVKFPPGYPTVLAVLWSVLGSLRAVTLAAVALNLLFLAGAGVALALALHRAGLARGAAVAIGGLALVSADVWRTALVPMSEAMFVALVATAFAAWEPAVRDRNRRGVALLAAVLTLAVLTRSAGWAVVAAFGVALAFSVGLRRAVALTLPAVVAGAGWAWWASSNAERIPVALRDVLGPYGGWFVDQVLGAPTAFLSALPAHATAVLSRVSTLIVPGVGGVWLWLAAVPVLAVSALGMVSLRRKLPPLPWVAAAYLAMLVLWPFVDRRLVAPLHPLLVVGAGTGFLELRRRIGQARLRVAVGAAAFAWVATVATVTAGRAARGWAVAGYQLRAGRLAAAVEALETTAPRDAVVGAPEFWAGLHLHGGWRTVPSARFAPRSEDDQVPVWGTPTEQLELWWGAGVRFLLLEQGGQIHGDALNLLEERCPGAVTILARMPPQMLVRLGWDDACATELGMGGVGATAAPSAPER